MPDRRRIAIRALTALAACVLIASGALLASRMSGDEERRERPRVAVA